MMTERMTDWRLAELKNAAITTGWQAAESWRQEAEKLRAELASRPCVLPDDVRDCLNRVASSGMGDVCLEAVKLLTKYASGVPAVQGEPVAWLLRNDALAVIAEKQISKPSGDWAAVDCDRMVLLTFEQSEQLRKLGLLNYGECRGIILTEPITPPHDVTKLPGYAYHNDVLTVFVANGRTALVRVNIDGEWWASACPNQELYTDIYTREAAERAASDYVMSSSDGGGA